MCLKSICDSPLHVLPVVSPHWNMGKCHKRGNGENKPKTLHGAKNNIWTKTKHTLGEIKLIIRFPSPAGSFSPSFAEKYFLFYFSNTPFSSSSTSEKQKVLSYQDGKMKENTYLIVFPTWLPPPISSCIIEFSFFNSNTAFLK